MANFMSRLSVYEGDYNCIFRDVHNELPSQVHYHDFFEIVIYLGQAGIFYINGKEYLIQKGDIALINMFEPHTLKYDTHSEYTRFSISIDPNLLLSFSTKKSNLLDIFQQGNKNYPVFHLDEKNFAKYISILNQFKTQNISHGRDILEKSLLHQLSAYLYSDCYNQIHTNVSSTYHVTIVSSLVEFINTHLNEDLSLKRLSEEVNYSIFYICKVFKKVTNCTITKYILEKRIETALHYLSMNIPIVKVAENVGFNNYSYFYKTFKKIVGCSPDQYRKNNQIS